MRIDPKDIAKMSSELACEAKDAGLEVVRLLPHLGKESVRPFIDEGLKVELVGCMCDLIEEGALESSTVFCEEVLRPAIRGWGFNVSILDCRETAKLLAGDER